MAPTEPGPAGVDGVEVEVVDDPDDPRLDDFRHNARGLDDSVDYFERDDRHGRVMGCGGGLDLGRYG